MELNKLYRPITPFPFAKQIADETTYVEIPPSAELAPYICCYWGTYQNIQTIASDVTEAGLVIPDTCMDIILRMNFTQNTIDNTFCGINEYSFTSSYKSETATVCTFAVRIYPWAVILFADDSMNDVANIFCETEMYFKDFQKQLQEQLLDSRTIKERIAITENFLKKKLDKSRQNHHVMNGIYKMLLHKGHVTMKELTNYATVSIRQLERLFKSHIGISPKKLSDLIRYQYLWQDVAFHNHFDVQDAVFQYGYSDQAHLINDFKKYHTMTPKEAKKYALNNR